LKSEDELAKPEEAGEAVQVLTIKDNRLYLSSDIRTAFDLHNGDKIVVYNASGNMMVKVVRRRRVPNSIDTARRTDEPL
jgi:hypothetical protein